MIRLHTKKNKIMTHQLRPSEDHEIEIKWMKIREGFLYEYRDLTPDDLHYNSGEFKKMLDRIVCKLGMTESQLRRRILRWEDSASHYF